MTPRRASQAEAKATGAQPNLAALAASQSSAVRYVPLHVDLLNFLTIWTDPGENFLCRRRAAQQAANRPNSTRAAGAGGSSNTMLRLYTDDNIGLIM